MIMNNFLDKTIRAAKQSALQIYGDDFSELALLLYEDEEPERKKEKQDHQNTPQKHGIIFERSSEAGNKTDKYNGSSTLQSLRKYAAQQSSTEAEEIKNWDTTDSSPRKENKTSSVSKQLYSRKDVRKQPNKDVSESNTQSAGNKVKAAKKREDQEDTTKSNTSPVDKTPKQDTETEAKEENLTDTSGNLLDRINKLESLVQLMLSPEDRIYASHPVYHKLLHKGVPKRMVTKWFDTICEQGIHPGNQKGLFKSKLQHTIRNLLSAAQSDRLSRLLLFSGRSGSGKTSLIMKLCRHTDFLQGKKIAIAAIHPSNKDYYTVLGPFCRDQDIPYYPIDADTSFGQLQGEWKSFDHVLIDTPSLEMEASGLVKTITDLRFELKDQMDLDIHYLINTAVDSNAFNDPLAAEIDANHIVLSHLDNSNKWGRAMQLIAQTDYSIRFISGGETIPDGLLPFDPELFTEKLLR